MVGDLNRFYHSHPALWENDFDWQGYEWIDFSDVEKSVISFLRKGEGCYLACVFNFTPEFLPDYWIKLGNVKVIKEAFNTDAAEYGGSNQLNHEIRIAPDGFTISLAPLAAMLFEVEFV